MAIRTRLETMDLVSLLSMAHGATTTAQTNGMAPSSVGRLVSGATFGEGNAPGGVMSITEDGVTFLRLQDPGDPRNYDFPDPFSNRKDLFRA